MTNPIRFTPSQVQARPLFRPAPRRAAQSAAEAIQAPRVWEVLWQVMHPQLAHDALLLWRYDRRHEQLSLLHAAPRFLQTAGVTVSGGEQLAPLAEGRLEALAHVHCAASPFALEQALWGWGLHSAITCLLGEHEREAYLITCGFRQRWAAHRPSQRGRDGLPGVSAGLSAGGPARAAAVALVGDALSRAAPVAASIQAIRDADDP